MFPNISNQKFNSYLKEISAVAGIEKSLTHHIARKTFEPTILLFNDVPMEIVSELEHFQYGNYARELRKDSSP